MTNWEKYFGTPEKTNRMDVHLLLDDEAEIRIYGDDREDGSAPIVRELRVEDYRRWLNEEADHD